MFPAYEEIQAQLKRIFDEAGPELDLSRVQSVPDEIRGNASAISRHVKALNTRFEECKAVDAAAEHARTAMVSAANGSTNMAAKTATPWRRASDRKPAALIKGQRFVDHEIVAMERRRDADREKAIVGQHGDLGSLLKTMSTTSGTAIVPTVWAGDIIDRARNASVVMQAGATVVPMDTKTVQIGRLTGDPTVAFRAENSAITPSDPVLDNVTLDAKTMSALVIGSMEWFQDAPNANEVVMNALAMAMAAELDRQALFGGVTTGGETGATGFNTTFPTPPNPRGVLATLLAVASSSVLGSGANGTTQTATSPWREVIQTVFTPRQFNEEPNGLIWNAKLWQQYADMYDTGNQPLLEPKAVTDIPKFVTNAIPSFTQGTMTTRATDLFVGDWRQLIVGQRLGVTIKTLVERYADNGQIGIVCHWRGDIQLARPRAFAVYRYLQGA